MKDKANLLWWVRWLMAVTATGSCHLPLLAQVARQPAETYYTKGIALQEQAKYDSALYCFTKSVDAAQKARQWRTYFDGQHQIIHTYRLSFRLDTAFIVLHELINTWTNKPEFTTQAAIASHQLAAQIVKAKGQYRAAYSSYSKALQLLQSTAAAKEASAATIYQEAGKLLLIQAKPDQALSYLLQALQIQKAISGNKHIALATIYEDIARAYSAIASPHEAMGYLEQALQIRKALLGEKHPGTAASLYLLGKQSLDILQAEQALQYLEQALSLQVQSGKENHIGTVHTYLAMGKGYAALGEDSLGWQLYKKGLHVYSQLLQTKHYSLLEDNLDNEIIALEIPAYSYLSGKQARKGDINAETEMSYQSWAEALEIVEDLTPKAAAVLGNMHPDVALLKESTAGLFARQFIESNTRKKAFSQINGVDVLKFIFDIDNTKNPEIRGENKKAAGLYAQAQSIRENVFGNKHPKVALSYIHQAQLLKLTNEFYVQYQQEVLARYQKLANKYSPGKAVTLWGITLYDGQKENIREFSNKYFHTLKTIADNDVQILQYYQQAISAVMPLYTSKSYLENPSFSTIPASQLPLQVMSSQVLIQALLEKVRFIAILPARPELQPVKGADYTEEAKSKDKPAETIAVFSREYQQRKSAYDNARPKVGIQTSYDAIRNLDQFISRLSTALVDDRDKFLLAGQTKEINLLAMNICYQLYELKTLNRSSNSTEPWPRTKFKGSIRGYLHEAFDYAEKSKASVLMQAMVAAQAGSRTEKNAPVGELQQLQTHIQSMKGEIAEKMSGMRGKDSLQVSILQDSIFRLSERYLALKRETSAKFFETSGELRYAGIRDIQKAIDDSTAVIAYNVAPERIFYFLITKNEFEFIVKRESRDDLERDVGHIRRLIYYRQTGDYIDYAQDLESKLIPKLDDDIKKLVIIPDGVLNTLPYEVLLRGRVRVKDKNNLKSFPYLIRSYDISYAYSASLMFGSPLKNLKEEARGLVAFAPVFSKTAEDGLSLTNKQVILASTDSVSQRSVLKEGRSINPLPATETEVQAIYDIFTRQKQPAQIFTHTMAAEEEAKAASISGYKYIHFATHGFVNTTHPELSGLILSQNKTSAEDGILYSGELYNLPLQADLVTLSACETGLGKIEAGEGVIGLPRALLYAGAKNVLVSLWKVADASTSQLMVDFYSRFLSGQSYSSALRQAKLRMIASPEYANPYYWSPFILIGK